MKNKLTILLLCILCTSACAVESEKPEPTVVVASKTVFAQVIELFKRINFTSFKLRPSGSRLVLESLNNFNRELEKVDETQSNKKKM